MIFALPLDSPSYDEQDGFFTATLELSIQLMRDNLGQEIECRTESVAIADTIKQQFAIDLQGNQSCCPLHRLSKTNCLIEYTCYCLLFIVVYFAPIFTHLIHWCLSCLFYMFCSASYKYKYQWNRTSYGAGQ